MTLSRWEYADSIADKFPNSTFKGRLVKFLDSCEYLPMEKINNELYRLLESSDIERYGIDVDELHYLINIYIDDYIKCETCQGYGYLNRDDDGIGDCCYNCKGSGTDVRM